jgi:type I restriction enzyme, S subunit
MSETVQIPKGWELKKLSDTGQITTGSTPKTSNSEFYGNDFPFYGPVDLGSKIEISESRKGLTQAGLDAARVIPEGSILVQCIGDIGKSSIIKKTGACNQQINVIIPNLDAVIPKFVYYWINSSFFRKQMSQHATQTTLPILNKTKFSNLPFFQPLLQTQKKIVQKLDDILGQLEEKKKEISKLKEKKDQAISLLSQKTIGGIIIHQMKLDNPPKDWQIKTIDECTDIQPGFAQGQKNIKDGTIHLRMNNIGRNFQINYDLVRTINATKDQLNKYKLENGDVVFNNTNSPELVGKSFIFNDDKICLYSNHLTRCRVKEDLILPEWLLFFIRGKWLRRDFEKMCNKWINQAAVGSNKLKNMKIPIPSLSEQKQIIKIIINASNQFEEISHLTSSIKYKDMENEKLIEHLQSSILDAAFSGKLVK